MKKGRDPIRVFRCSQKGWKLFCKAVKWDARTTSRPAAAAGRSALIRELMGIYVASMIKKGMR